MPTETPTGSPRSSRASAGELPYRAQRSWRRHFGLRRIDLYLISEVLGPFIAGILFFSFLFLMFQALKLADLFIVHGVSLRVLVKMMALLTLQSMPFALPIAFLIGVLVGFGRLSSDNELIALKANGLSIYRLATPLILFSGLVMLFSLGLNLDWVPWGDRTFKGQLIRVTNTKVVTSIREGTFNTGFFDLLIYADRLDPVTNRLHRVFIYDERDAKNPQTIVAQEGEIVTVRTGSDLSSAIVLKLYRGNIHRSEVTGESYQKIDFNEYRLYLKIDEGINTAAMKPRMMSHAELREIVATRPPDSEYRREHQIELWRRYSLAVTPLIFVFLGIGFGTFRTRSVRAGAALIAFVISASYWTLQVWVIIAAQKQIFHPAVALMIPNLILGVIAIFAFRKATF